MYNKFIASKETIVSGLQYSADQIKTSFIEPDGFRLETLNSPVKINIPIIGKAKANKILYDNFNNPFQIWFSSPVKTKLANPRLNLSVDSICYSSGLKMILLYLSRPVKIQKGNNKLSAEIITIDISGRLRAGATSRIKSFFVEEIGLLPVKFVNLSISSGLFTLTPKNNIFFSVPFLENSISCNSIRLAADNKTIEAFMFSNFLKLFRSGKYGDSSISEVGRLSDNIFRYDLPFSHPHFHQLFVDQYGQGLLFPPS